MSGNTRSSIIVAKSSTAYTYMLASKLPEWILDGLLSMPARLAEVRNRLIPIVLHPEKSKPVARLEEEEEPEEIDAAAEKSHHSDKATPASSGYSSDAEVLSLHSNDQMTTGSWVSLKEKQHE